jgi:hypothetical protein
MNKINKIIFQYYDLIYICFIYNNKLIIMDKLSDIEFAVTSFVLKPKRHTYCFDRCFTTFEK